MGIVDGHALQAWPKRVAEFAGHISRASSCATNNTPKRTQDRAPPHDIPHSPVIVKRRHPRRSSLVRQSQGRRQQQRSRRALQHHHRGVPTLRSAIRPHLQCFKGELAQQSVAPSLAHPQQAAEPERGRVEGNIAVASVGQRWISGRDWRRRVE